MAYSRLQILLHWGVAALVLSQWLTYDAIVRTHNPLLPPRAIDLFEHKLHNYGGIAVAVLIAVRLLLRFRRRSANGNSAATSRVAGLVHWLLYGLIFLQAATGFTASYVTSAAMPVHRALWSLVWPLIGLHVLAAAYHLLRQDGVARRMWPG